MKAVPISEARRLAKHAGADRMVILYVTEDGHFGATTYGRTKALCDATRRWSEDHAEDVALQLLHRT